ncbi:MAG: hypothetical protein GY851_33315 [bacterium]|nr:hypothetical protein [bacterium]
MSEFEDAVLNALEPKTVAIVAWSVMPNHYHALIETESLEDTLRGIAQLHGRTSFRWNQEEDRRGRKVWYNCMERAIRSERHLWATLNYVHHNPVHHGYVDYWQDWPYSSATAYLASVGREEARRVWLEYPILDYGASWDT